MLLPSRFEEKLRQDRELTGGVLLTLSTFDTWLKLNKLTFFEEFTDHGPDHINEVFATADWLIDDASWNSITPADVGTLILAVLVHDSGMHLQPDGFLALLNEDRILEGHGDKSWDDLYQTFLAQAKRFDGAKLRVMFGSDVPVSIPGKDPELWTKRDRRLIGEFLRQHHPRLAHEIAVFGVPGYKQDRLSFQGVPKHLADFAGLVARSHGVPLRHAVDNIKEADRRQDRSVHLPYLMAVLRIADYMQIQNTRAPRNLYKIATLKSPVSQDEWDKHDAIEDVRYDTDFDNEAIYIKAAPKSARLYVKLRELLDDIQRELDVSWAVLGELYGRFQPLGFRLRRIKSNLDDLEAYARTVNYVPERVTIEAAGPDLMNLLTAPLYGDKPEIGVRELVQNAVDACRELKHLQAKGQSQELEQVNRSADITLLLKTNADGGGVVMVQDKGVGMTLDTIKNYFLKAGASFRKSPLWREAYLNEEGQSEVLRSGRFGIGVLAAFLLGDKLEVTTRHVTAESEDALSFTCTIEEQFIEVRRVQAAVGTTVMVHVSEGVWQHIQAHRSAIDWYCLEEPSLKIIWDGKAVQQKHCLPGSDTENLPYTWHRLLHPDYEAIHWTFDINLPSVVCNGIKVIDEAGQAHREEFREIYPLQEDNPFRFRFVLPKLSVFDADTKLPLNLQRDQIYYQELPFRKLLFEEMVKDLLAYMLVRTPQVPPTSYPNLQLYESYMHTSMRWAWGKPRLGWFYFDQEGVALLDPTILRRTNPHKLVFATKSIAERLGPLLTEPAVVMENLNSKGRVKQWFRTMFYRDRWVETKAMRPDRARITAAPGFHDVVNDPSIFSRVQRENLYQKVSRRKGAQGEWWTFTSATLKNAPESHLVERIRSLPAGETHAALAEWYFPTRSAQIRETLLGKVWQKYIGTSVIPFDLKLRREKLAEAFDSLGEYVRKYEKS